MTRIDNRRGFTLIEIIVTVAVLAIIASLAIPSLIPWYNNQKDTERAANAQSIYANGQLSMVDLKARGYLANRTSSTGTPLRTQISAISTSFVTSGDISWPASNATKNGTSALADAGLIVLSNDSATGCSEALDTLLPNIESKLSNVGFMQGAPGSAGRYYIELNPTTGYVFSVFYSERTDFAVGDNSAQAGTYKWASAHRNDAAALAERQIAYYGGDTLTIFEGTRDLSLCRVGYFEFDASNAITGAYFFTVNENGQCDGVPSDLLSNDNNIDHTAYGIIAPEALLAEYTPAQSGTGTLVSNTISVEGMNAEYTFYPFQPSGLAAFTPWTGVLTIPELNDRRFVINTNFAASVAAGTSFAPITGKYDIRTADQLEHIQYPLNDSDSTRYLRATNAFYQTHDIKIDRKWDPIGTKYSTTSSKNAVFSGTYTGGYSGGNHTPSALKAQEGSSTYFKVELADGFELAMVKDTAAAASDSKIPLANGTLYPFQNYTGIFGMVGGSSADRAALSHVSLVATGQNIQVVSTDSTLKNGSASALLVGHMRKYTDCTGCSLTINKGASVSLGYQSYTNGSDNSIGALIGVSNDATRDGGAKNTIDNCKVTVGGDLKIYTNGSGTSYATEHGLQFAGTLVGLSATPLTNSKVTVNEGGSVDAFITTATTTRGDAYIGGVVGYDSYEGSSLALNKISLNVNGDISLKTQAGVLSYGGGITGMVLGKNDDQSVTIGENGSLAIDAYSESTAHAPAFVGGADACALGETKNVSLTNKGALSLQARGTGAGNATTGSNYRNNFAGGLIGKCDSHVSDLELNIDAAAKKTEIIAAHIKSSRAGLSVAGGAIGAVASGDGVNYGAASTSDSVENVKVTVDSPLSIEASSVFPTATVGGAVGATAFPCRNMSIRATADISLTATSGDTDQNLVGGMVGAVWNSAKNFPSSIENSYLASTKGTVYLNNNSSKSTSGVSGFANIRATNFQGTANMVNCYTNANFSVETASRFYGFTNDNASSIDNCYTLGTVKHTAGNGNEDVGFIYNITKGLVSDSYTAMEPTEGDGLTSLHFTRSAGGKNYSSNCFELDTQPAKSLINQDGTCDQSKLNGGYLPTKDSSTGIWHACYSYMTSTATSPVPETASGNNTYTGTARTVSMVDQLGGGWSTEGLSDYSSEGAGSYMVADNTALGNNPFPTSTTDTAGAKVHYGNWCKNPALIWIDRNPAIFTKALFDTYYDSRNSGALNSVSTDSGLGTTAVWPKLAAVSDGYLFRYSCGWRVYPKIESNYMQFYTTQDISIYSGRSSADMYPNNAGNGGALVDGNGNVKSCVLGVSGYQMAIAKAGNGLVLTSNTPQETRDYRFDDHRAWACSGDSANGNYPRVAVTSSSPCLFW